jgi:hypothetical protein
MFSFSSSTRSPRLILNPTTAQPGSASQHATTIRHHTVKQRRRTKRHRR